MTTPTIPAGNLYMNATLYTGNGSTQTITNGVAGQSFQPDLVWVKGRSSANQDHTLVDSVRGVSRRIRSNATTAEVLESGFTVTAFNSSGFTAVDDTNGGYNVNGSVGGTFSGAALYVAWQWKAGGTAVSNTSGTITSQVSANTTSGFSVVTYTGTGANATVGHGLGVAPAMIIVKGRTTTLSWPVYATAMGSTTAYLTLDSTAASVSLANMWNSTAPTSSTFSVGSNSLSNQSAQTFVAYCWAPIAGYSAFGSYTGNGSADGAFVYTGFRPRFILVKRTDAAGYYWIVHDTVRNTYNLMDLDLYPNAADAEGTSSGRGIDALSNGFKLRGTGGETNASGGTFIYACFAENPFKYSNAR